MRFRKRPLSSTFIRCALLCSGVGLALSPYTAAAAPVVCSPADPVANADIVCTGDPCIVTKNWEFAGDCEMDFGMRNLVVRGKNLVAPGANFRIRAGSVKAEKSGSSTPLISVRGGESLRGGNLEIFSLSFIDFSGTADASGVPGGNITMTAVGDITLAVLVKSNGLTIDAGGGNITIIAGQDLFQTGGVEADGGATDAGGNITLSAARNLVSTKTISARGGEFSGGWLSFTAGDDVTISDDLDASSGSGGGDGGMIDILAGADGNGGEKPGGTATILGTLINLTPSNTGTGSDAWAGDGGDLFIDTSGDLYIGPAVKIKNWGAAPDGSGGDVLMLTSDLVTDEISALDGNMNIQGEILNTGQGASSDGGDVTLSAGRDLTVGKVDVSSGWLAGDFSADAGGNVSLTAPVLATGGGSDGDGGAIDVTAGLAAMGTLAVGSGASLLARGGSFTGPSLGGDVSLAGCTVNVASATAVDARGGVGLNGRPFGGSILLVTSIGGNLQGNFTATPAGDITIVHKSASAPSLTGATFDPAPAIEILESSPIYPGCGQNPTPTPTPSPQCGNGTVEFGEGCDDGNTNSGDCCSGACQVEPDGSSCPSGDQCLEGQCSAGACVFSSVANCLALGDIDCNGAMDTADALTELCFFVGLCGDSDVPSPCNDPAHRLAVADWDLNGQINASDALTTLALFVKLIGPGDTALGSCCQ